MRCAVLGSPVAHSLSPAMHRAAYAEAGLEGWTYEAQDVGEGALAAHLDALDRSWRGLSLTMPLKREAVSLVDSLDNWAGVTGAVNTVLLTERRRLGFNTDVPGAQTALAAHGVTGVAEVLVLGGGATATSVLMAAVELGCTRARVQVRDPARAAETERLVSAHPSRPEVVVETWDTPVAAPDLVVSTVPAGALTQARRDEAAGAPAVFDVVYDPWPTPLAQAARDAGSTVVTGLDLLAHQAVLQLQVLAGVSVTPALLREAALEELARRG